MLLSLDFIKYIPKNMVTKIQRITFKLPMYDPISIKIISSSKGIKIRMYPEIFMRWLYGKNEKLSFTWALIHGVYLIYQKIIE